MTPQTLTFDSAGTACAAWHLPAVDDRLATAAGRPVVVLAHGLGGTKDSGLLPFAEAFAAAGLDAFLFDYRGFGGSAGEPRQVVSLAGQLDDWQAAMRAAARLPGVDPRRLVLWGVSLAGGHVLAAAAGHDDVAAVVSVVPLVDGLAAGRHAFASHSAAEIGRSTLLGIRSRVGRVAGRGPRMMPVVARPGELGALTLPGALEDYLAIAGPTWRNEVAADVSLELGSREPLKRAADVRCPVLVQIADFDRSAPPQASAKAAFRARAEVRHYPGDHFDLFPGKPWHESAVEHAVSFLTRHLSPPVLRRLRSNRLETPGSCSKEVLLVPDTVQQALLALADSDRPGLAFEDRRWTWSEVVSGAAARAHVLAGMADPDRPLHVGVLMENTPEMVLALAAGAIGGHVTAGINDTRRGQALAADVRRADCQVLLTDAEHLPLLDGLDLGGAQVVDTDAADWADRVAAAPETTDGFREVEAFDTFMLIFTSGTSGDPKAVKVANFMVMLSGANLTERFGLTADDVCYAAMPLFHSNAVLAGFAPALCAGATLALARRFSASGFLPDVRRFGRRT